MKHAFLLNKTDLAPYLRELGKKGFSVQVPITNRSGSTSFSKLKAGKLFLETRADFSPKKFFMPAREELMHFVKNSKGLNVKETAVAPKRVVFGLRSCDLHAAKKLDKVFFESPADEFYEKKRKSTYLIGLSCKTSLPSCFCTSLETNSPVGFDLFFWEKKEQYYVEVGSVWGAKLVSKRFFSGTRLVKHSQNPKQNIKINAKGIDLRLEKRFNHRYWKEVGEKCVSCGACTIVCPTCACFFISDFFDLLEPKRIREESSCQFSAYTTIASGETKRKTEKSRQRHRVLCKFPYFNQTFQEFSCIGCGRCTDACIAGIKLHEILKKVAG